MGSATFQLYSFKANSEEMLGLGAGAYHGLLPYPDQSHAYRLSASLASRYHQQLFLSIMINIKSCHDVHNLSHVMLSETLWYLQTSPRRTYGKVMGWETQMYVSKISPMAAATETQTRGKSPL